MSVRVRPPPSPPKFMFTSKLLKPANEHLDQLTFDLLAKKAPRFYSFDQNNSGGSYDVDEEQGIDCHVFIQAFDAEHANSRACDIGIYFNGVEENKDCECCGDRWHPCSESDGYTNPNDGYISSDYTVHHLDGSIVQFLHPQPNKRW
jgi:hypothetical protein